MIEEAWVLLTKHGFGAVFFFTTVVSVLFIIKLLLGDRKNLQKAKDAQKEELLSALKREQERTEWMAKIIEANTDEKKHLSDVLKEVLKRIEEDNKLTAKLVTLWEARVK